MRAQAGTDFLMHLHEILRPNSLEKFSDGETASDKSAIATEAKSSASFHTELCKAGSAAREWHR